MTIPGPHSVCSTAVSTGKGCSSSSICCSVAVPALQSALAATSARKVYVCNLRPQDPETTGYGVAAHVAALAAHGLEVDVALCHPGALPMGDVGVVCVEEAVAAPDLSEHDPVLLGEALSRLI